MPGAYAYIVLVNLLKELDWLDAIAGPSDLAKCAVFEYFKNSARGPKRISTNVPAVG